MRCGLKDGGASWSSAVRTLILAALLTLSAAEVLGREITGRVTLVSQTGRPVRSTDVENAVVYFESRAGGEVGRRDEAEVLVSTIGKAFEPRVTAVQTGTEVRFPNSDPILHNVFSVSPGNRFDLGLYQRGRGKSHDFDRPGVVQIFCNVHYSMIGYILVLETPHFAKPDRGGSFRLTGLPEGPGVLRVWHERAESWSRPIEIAAAGRHPVDVELTLNRRRVPPHKNKFGKPYRRSRRGNDY